MTIGQPLPRPDGRAKVTGAARYATDQNLPNQLHAALVTSPIPAGRVVSIDSAQALSARGVVRVLTQADLPRFGQAPSPPLASAFMPMQGDEVRHEGQPVAIVLGETLEAAEHGARLVGVRYELGAFAMPGHAPVSGPSNEVQHAHEPNDKSGYLFAEAQFRKGDFHAGLASAAHRHEAVYSQPSRHNNPMEPSATLAHWHGDRLTTTTRSSTAIARSLCSPPCSTSRRRMCA